MKKIFLILFLFSGIFFLWNLGATYLTNWDEAWYAGISRSMLERNDFITPYWNGAPYFDKGPLYHWFSVLAFQIFPRWEIAARLPSALAGIGCVILTYLLGKALFSQKVGLVAGLILSSTIGFLFRARTGNLDTMVVFFILLSFLFFFLAQKQPRYFLALGASLGLLFLTKTAFFLYPLFIIFLIILYKRSLKTYKNCYVVGGIFLAILLPGIWLFLGTMANGQAFWDFYLNLFFWPMSKFGELQETAGRFSEKYFFYLFYGTKIWFFFFPPALLFALIKTVKDYRFFFLLIAFIPYFFILLATQEAGDWYLLPLYPIAALMVGVFCAFIQEKILPARTGAILLVSGFFLLALAQNFSFRHLFIVPETLKNEVLLSKTAKELTDFEKILIIDDYYFPVASFYSERKIKVVRREASDTALVLSKESFYRTIQDEKKVIILTTAENFTQISRDLKSIDFKVERQADNHLLVSKK